MDKRRAELAHGERLAALAADRLDRSEVISAQVTSVQDRGHLHLVTQARDELEEGFVGMGFEVAEGPEAESDWYNFEALNMPPAHPARGMYDTMYLDIGEPETALLRTHTSPVQIHLMEAAVRDGTLPIHAVMPGKCSRPRHPRCPSPAGVRSDRGARGRWGITFGDLAGTIETYTSAYFGEGYARASAPPFPFTEPSAEYEITCAICFGKGCRTCSHTGWIELGGCGMVDPAVFAAVGIDAAEWSGFAWVRDRSLRLDAPRDSRHPLLHGKRHPIPSKF